MSPFQKDIDQLRFYLEHIPGAFVYSPAFGSEIKDFQLDSDWIADIGEEGAANRELEIQLGSRAEGPIQLRGRGPGLSSLPDFLGRYLQQYPSSAILEKWLSDLLASARSTYSETTKSSHHGSHVNPPALSASETPSASLRDSKGKGKAKKDESKALPDYHDPDFQSCSEGDDSRKGGAKLHQLLQKISLPCRQESKTDDEESKKRVRCLGSKGCKTSWKWPRNRQRIFKHAKDCAYLPMDLRREVIWAMARKAIGPQATISTDGGNADSDVEQMRPPKRSRNDTGSVVSAASTLKSSGSFKKFVAEGKKMFQDNANHALLVFIACNGIPPTVVDSPEFKRLMSILNNNYQPPSESTLSDRLIPDEAAKIHFACINYLQRCRNLTITFDGGRLRGAKGLYTVHVITAERRSFCMTLDDASRLSHTGEYIAELLERYISEIGTHNFSGICSDNTGNTSRARRLINAKYGHILNLQDACHELNLVVAEICCLTFFKSVVSQLRSIIAHMSKATYTQEHFDYQRTKLGISRGLESIGETRFGTIYWAGESLLRGVAALKVITNDERLRIKIPSLDHPTALLELEMELTKLLPFIGPMAKSIKCLESAHSVAADVFLFWLAIMAQLDQIFNENKIHVPSYVKEQIRAIINRRYSGMIDNAPTDVYVAAFFLDPRYRHSDVFSRKSINPLTVPSVVISHVQGHPIAKAKKDDGILKRVGLCLQRILKNEYGDAYAVGVAIQESQEIMKDRNHHLAHLTPTEALAELKTQLKAYAEGEEPFDRFFNEKELVREWWTKVQKKRDAAVLGSLAIKIYSIAVVSMEDERTMSAITWLNSARRSRQLVSTVQDHIKIRQWHRYNPTNVDPNLKPVPKWCDLKKVLGKQRDTDALPTTSPPNLPALPADADSQMQTQTLDDGLDVFDEPEPDLTDVDGTTFISSRDINLQASVLLDVLADQPRIQVQQGTKSLQDDTVSRAVPAAPQEVEWDLW